MQRNALTAQAEQRRPPKQRINSAALILHRSCVLGIVKRRVNAIDSAHKARSQDCHTVLAHTAEGQREPGGAQRVVCRGSPADHSTGLRSSYADTGVDAQLPATGEELCAHSRDSFRSVND